MTDILSEDNCYTCRNNPTFIGHEDAEQFFLSRTKHETMPHAWLISGIKGIGKATLAYRFARFLLNNESQGLFGAPSSLDMDPEHPVFRKIVLGSHPDILVLERGVDQKTGKIARDIVVEDARRIGKFLRLTPAESSHRVVIIDSVDEMNRNAANSILKLLEEPPQGAIIILISHTPGRVLPTIRSRCCHIKLQPLPDNQMTEILARIRPEISGSEVKLLQKFAKGTPGVALELYNEGIMELYDEILSVMSTMPRLDQSAVHKLGERLAVKSNTATWQYGSFLLQHCLNMIIKAGVAHDNILGHDDKEQQMIKNLLTFQPIEHWLSIWDKINDISKDVERINLDPKLVTLQLFDAMQEPA